MKFDTIHFSHFLGEMRDHSKKGVITKWRRWVALLYYHALRHETDEQKSTGSVEANEIDEKRNFFFFILGHEDLPLYPPQLARDRRATMIFKLYQAVRLQSDTILTTSHHRFTRDWNSHTLQPHSIRAPCISPILLLFLTRYPFVYIPIPLTSYNCCLSSSCLWTFVN